MGLIETLKGLAGVNTKGTLDTNSVNKGIGDLVHGNNSSTFHGFNDYTLMGGYNIHKEKDFWWENKSDYCNYRYVRAFEDCPVLSTVIIEQSKYFTNGKTWILRRNPKENLGKKNATKAELAGEEVFSREANLLRRLLENPNKEQTNSQFEAEMLINLGVFEWCLLYINKPIGYKNIDAESIHIVSPSQIEFKYKYNWKTNNKSWENIRHILVHEKDGSVRELRKDDCYLIKGTLPSFNIDSFLPTSRIELIKQPIQNIIDGLESRGVLLRERGIRGIITNQTTDSNSFINVSKTEKDEFMSELRRQYGLLKGQFQIAFSNKDLKYQKMSIPTSELMLFEEDENSTDKIIGVYGFPKELFPTMSKGSTFSNIGNQSRNYYQNTIIPLARCIYEQYNKIFETSNYGFYIEKDYSSLPALQADRKEFAEAQLRLNQSCNIAFQMNIIDMNEWRKALDEDPIEGYDGVFYSDIKDKVNATVDIKDTQINDGNSINTLNNEGTLNQTV